MQVSSGFTRQMYHHSSNLRVLHDRISPNLVVFHDHGQGTPRLVFAKKQMMFPSQKPSGILGGIHDVTIFQLFFLLDDDTPPEN